MRNFKFRTIRNITFTFAAIVVLLFGTMTDGAVAAADTSGATGKLFDRLFGSNEIVNSFLAGTEIVVLPHSLDDNLAPLATETWSGGDGNDSDWTSNDNWAGIGGAGPNDDLVFPSGAARLSNVNNFAINTSFDSLTFTGRGYLISGNQIFLENGMTLNVPNGAGALPIFNPNIILGAHNIWTANSGNAVELNGVINLNDEDLLLNGGGVHRIDGTVTDTVGNGSIFKQGSGTAILNGSVTRPAIVESGRLRIGGTLSDMAELRGGTLEGEGTVESIFITVPNDNPTIAPGDGGTDTGILDVSGSTTLSSDVTYSVDLNGTIVDTEYDRLRVFNDINLAGTTLVGTLGFTPSVGQQFTIVQTIGAGNNVIGQFAQGTGITIGGQPFAITYNATSVVLTAQEPAVFEMADTSVIEGNSGTTAMTYTISSPVPTSVTCDINVIIRTDVSTATAPDDFVFAQDLNFVFTAGQSSRTFTITVNGDTNVEPDEFVRISISGGGSDNPAPDCATAGGTARGTIINDDGATPTPTPTPTPTALTWDGGGATNNWSEAANWNPDFVPADGMDLTFPAGVPADSLANNNNIAGLDVRSIAINGIGYDLGGNAITLSNGITANQPSGGTSEIKLDITLSTQAQSFINSATGTGIDIEGDLNLNNFALTLDGANNASLNFTGAISGAGGITKTGASQLLLQGAGNSYSGVTAINSGSVILGTSTGLGAEGAGNNTVVANGASLSLSNAVVNIPEAITLPEATMLTINTTALDEGRLGVLIDSGEAFKAGASAVIWVTFEVAANSSSTVTQLAFDDSLINRGTSNAEAESLPTRYVAGPVVILARPGISLSGRVTTADGRGIRNAVVVITGDSLARPISVVTGSFGYYQVDNLTAGETYLVSLAARRFRFPGAGYSITLTESIRNADFTAEPGLPKPPD